MQLPPRVSEAKHGNATPSPAAAKARGLTLKARILEHTSMWCWNQAIGHRQTAYSIGSLIRRAAWYLCQGWGKTDC